MQTFQLAMQKRRVCTKGRIPVIWSLHVPAMKTTLTATTTSWERVQRNIKQEKA